ncbi:MAG TPA: hypothetical protein PLS50_06235, partial [Candidatus Dojkabacteria bacterium]|nr:hypothetical protein [Candidatus Dojkabacteria bacterium]
MFPESEQIQGFEDAQIKLEARVFPLEQIVANLQNQIEGLTTKFMRYEDRRHEVQFEEEEDNDA